MSSKKEKPVFELQEVTNSLVIIKVNANDTLTIARHPYLNGNMEYISVTRGRKNILTVINKNGTTDSFFWGDGGYTVINGTTAMLKKAVTDFIQSQHILLGWDGRRWDEASIYFNNNFDKYMLRISGGDKNDYLNDYVYFDKGASLEEVREYADVVLGKQEWTENFFGIKAVNKGE